MTLGANSTQINRVMDVIGTIMNDEQLDAISLFVEDCQLIRAIRKLK